ncbi:MAG: hypothetical protein ACRDTG_04870 [Pseudonocardiaceae bacterium]
MSAPQWLSVTVQAANDLLQQLKIGKEPSYARKLFEAPELPSLLRQLQQSINQGRNNLVADLTKELIKPKLSLIEKFELPVDSPVAQMAFRDMASGAGDYAGNLEDSDFNLFLLKLFNEIIDKHRQTEATVLDLFHGHIVVNESQRDVCIIFHSKEWPIEELPPKSEKYKSWVNFGLAPDTPKEFSLKGKEMDERNFLWTLHSNCMWLLSDSNRRDENSRDSGFALLLPSPGDDVASLTPWQWYAGTVQEQNFGTELLGVNYFPTVLTRLAPAEKLFLAPVGAWGVLLYLEKKYPVLPAADIEKIYKKNEESKRATEKEIKKELELRSRI